MVDATPSIRDAVGSLVQAAFRGVRIQGLPHENAYCRAPPAGDEGEQPPSSLAGASPPSSDCGARALLGLASHCQSFLGADAGADAVETAGRAFEVNDMLSEIRVHMANIGTKGPAASREKVRELVKKVAAELPNLSEAAAEGLQVAAQAFLGAPDEKHARDMREGIVRIAANGQRVHDQYAKASLGKLLTAMRTAREELALLAGGLDEGASWKDGVADDASWESMQEPLKRFLDGLDEKKCSAAALKLTKALAAYTRATAQSGTPADEVAEAITSPTETLALAHATMIEYSLGNALTADDDDTREDCKNAAGAMIKEGVPETAIHPRLLNMARTKIGQR